MGKGTVDPEKDDQGKREKFRFMYRFARRKI